MALLTGFDCTTNVSAAYTERGDFALGPRGFLPLFFALSHTTIAAASAMATTTGMVTARTMMPSVVTVLVDADGGTATGDPGTDGVTEKVGVAVDVRDVDVENEMDCDTDGVNEAVGDTDALKDTDWVAVGESDGHVVAAVVG